ncbi:aminotransferase class V-fold PLP-dependent enzyme [Pontibacter sp. JH31]|uniref:Aminotransferase class V-fold PLP-dependent enzyme n=1 Tax=Pontibacter aquaedesilientis TaxID=2766980 RepID=A0ABR7XER6_9BACT|nr:aminotransferase class V-fold PLP-dependent enzyme [Pontibacter aquaedesilientis]MBD1396782.1 aminotransferase class V-fold PLP-dependent enzyme [Pontibacter aquaedesilientis]
MTNKVFFTPGPSELYPTVLAHMQSAMENKIGSISHRSQQFKDIYAHAVAGLRRLLQLPDNYEVLFLSSANEIWERAIQNLVQEESFHLVNGSFSKRFYEISAELGKKTNKFEVPFGEGFRPEEVAIPDTAELVALIHNETSSGVSIPVADIAQYRQSAPKESLLFVDAVSSLPHPEFDYNQMDSVYFSVQKCFGLPAGLGVWLLNERCLAKAHALQKSGISLGSYHTIPVLVEKGRAHQTPETPNVLNLYLLGKVVDDMNKKGIATIRQETETKARLIYDFLEKSKNFEPAVQNTAFRSLTTIVANTRIPAAELNKLLAPYDMAIGSGYGSYKDTQIRIANFPAHTVSQVEALLYELESLGV